MLQYRISPLKYRRKGRIFLLNFYNDTQYLISTSTEGARKLRALTKHFRRLEIVEIPPDNYDNVVRTLPEAARLMKVDFQVTGHISERVFIDMERYLSQPNGALYHLGYCEVNFLEICYLVFNYPSWAVYVSAYLRNVLICYRLIYNADHRRMPHYRHSYHERLATKAGKTYDQMVQSEEAVLQEMNSTCLPPDLWNICLQYRGRFLDLLDLTERSYMYAWEKQITKKKHLEVAQRMLRKPNVRKRFHSIPVASTTIGCFIHPVQEPNSDSDESDDENYPDCSDCSNCSYYSDRSIIPLDP